MRHAIASACAGGSLEHKVHREPVARHAAGSQYRGMVTDSGTDVLPAGVYSDGTRLWRPKRGATSTFEENVAARELFVDLHRDEFWNPWRLEARLPIGARPARHAAVGASRPWLPPQDKAAGRC